MNERTKKGLEILQAAILLGILADVLLRRTPWGLNAFLFVGAFSAAILMLVRRRQREFWNKQFLALNGALVFFAAMFVWRDSIQLRVFDTMAIFTILAILTLPGLKVKTHLAGVFHYVVGFLWSGVIGFIAPFFLIFDDIKWKGFSASGWSKNLFAVLRGLAIATPILFVFGALFMAADAAFEGIVQRTLNVDFEFLFTHAFLIAGVSWFTAGYLRGALTENFVGQAKEAIFERDEPTKMPSVVSVTEIKEEDTEEKPPPEEKKKRQWQNIDNSFLPQSLTFGAIETSIVLGLINLLFVSFIIVQIPYLFGGMDLVQNTPDFKLAEYARRGFGELVLVAALVLPILLFSHWLLRKDNPINAKIYSVLAGIQIVLLFVIMLSAAQRLFLLTGNLGYGLTTARLYPMAFMILLALVFIWFSLTVLRGAREQFAWGALWISLFVLGTLHVFNPDDYIVRTNVRLFQQGRAFDSYYLAELSDDAVPAMFEAMPLMTQDERDRVTRRLANRFCEKQKETDFRSWNLSRWQAKRLFEENRSSIEPYAYCNSLEY
jgi:Domain of unknown function (DUF4153)